MADYVIFKIGDVDYTPKIKLNDYTAHRDDVTESWIDGNHITRSSVIRTRVTGSVKMVLRKSEFNALLADLETAKITPGVYRLQVHIDNETMNTETTTINAFVKVNSSVVFGTKTYMYNPTATAVSIDFEEI